MTFQTLEMLTMSAVTCGFLYLSYKKVKQLLKNDEDTYSMKVLFFTDQGIRNRNENSIITVETFTRPICDFIDGATKDLIVVFYVISAYNIVEAIIKAKNRGVKVVIIVDYYFGYVNSQYTKRFIKEGIPVYSHEYDHNATIMHNKFCIRDGSCLMVGSMNITQSALKGSFENVIITNDVRLVEQYQEIYRDMRKYFYLLTE